MTLVNERTPDPKAEGSGELGSVTGHDVVDAQCRSRYDPAVDVIGRIDSPEQFAVYSRVDRYAVRDRMCSREADSLHGRNDALVGDPGFRHTQSVPYRAKVCQHRDEAA